MFGTAWAAALSGTDDEGSYCPAISTDVAENIPFIKAEVGDEYPLLFRYCINWAEAPATTGVAIEVPDL